MSKKIAIFLCLVLTFWGIPQTNNKVLAADLGSCPDNDISRNVQYTVEGNTQRWDMKPSLILEEPTNAIYFILSGKLTPGKSYKAYIKKAGEIRWGLPDGYSNQGIFNGNSIELSISKSTSPGLFERTASKDSHYEVNLLEEPFDNSHPLCRITDYKIGQPLNLKPCIVKLISKSGGPYARGGDQVVADVSNVFGGPVELKISYPPVNGHTSFDENQSAKTVLINKDGTGKFTFYTGSSFLTGASVVVDNRIDAGEGIPPLNYSCDANFDITNQSGSTTKECLIGSSPTQPNQNDDPIQLTVLDKPTVTATNLEAGTTYWARLIKRNLGEAGDLPDRVVAMNPARTATFNLSPTGYLPEGRYAAQVYSLNAPNDPVCTSKKDFIIGPPNILVPPSKVCSEQDVKDGKCASGGGEKAQGCTDDPNNPAIVTAIGCIHTNPAELIKDLMKFVIGISGGLAFLMMLLGAFQMLTSAGNPETLNAGRDRLTSAVIGLLFVIFAILLLQIIGVDILQIPGFGR